MNRMLLVSMLLSVTGFARAADAGNSWRAIGTLGCSQYVEGRKEESELQDRLVEMWASGYVTAANMLTADTFNLLANTSTKALVLSLKNYCRANPFSDTGMGLRVLIEELYPERHKAAKDASK